MAAAIEITRYPNRRLYDRSRGQYVTLAELEQLVRAGQTIEVRDSKTGEDLTRAVLTQILLEKHPERMELFPVGLLHVILQANDLALDWLRNYLRQSLALLQQLPQGPNAWAPPGGLPFSGPPLDWMRTFWSAWPLPGATNSVPPAVTPPPNPPAAAGVNPPDAPATGGAGESTAAETESVPPAVWAARLEALERRLRELEARQPSP